MPAGVAKTDVPCPLCEYKGRSDTTKKHVINQHAKQPVPTGWRAMPSNPLVITKLIEKHGVVKSAVGVCLQCGTCIRNIDSSVSVSYIVPGFAVFEAHRCKAKQIRTSAPSTPVAPSPTPPEPSLKSLYAKFKEQLPKYAMSDELRAKVTGIVTENEEFFMDEDAIDYENLLLSLLAEFAMK